jgi:hypothetical protein
VEGAVEVVADDPHPWTRASAARTAATRQLEAKSVLAAGMLDTAGIGPGNGWGNNQDWIQIAAAQR